MAMEEMLAGILLGLKQKAAGVEPAPLADYKGTFAEKHALADARDLLAALSTAGKAIEDDWRTIDSAPKDGTTIWAVLRADIYPGLHPLRDDLERWNGLQLPLRHPGIAADGFDIGWNIAAPVGHGGIPDGWIAGWRSLPPAPAAGGKDYDPTSPLRNSDCCASPDANLISEPNR